MRNKIRSPADRDIDPHRIETTCRLATLNGTQVARGNRLGSVRSFLAIARKYAWNAEKLQGAAADHFLFPTEAVLAHVLIAKEDERARLEAKGARKGETVSDRLRVTIIFAAENLK